MARRTPGVPDFESLRAPAHRPHLLLNAVEFATRTREDEGASYDVGTGHFLGEGQEAYVVGGEQDKHGKRIPEVQVPGKGLSVSQAASHIENVRHATGNRPQSLAGSWYEKGADNTVLDASRAYTSQDDASKFGRARGERAGWDNKRGKEFPL